MITMLFLKRLLLFLVTVSVVVFAIAISGLNTEKVLLNFYFFSYEFSIGFALILSIFGGLLIGWLMALFSFYMPLKTEIRKLSRKNRELTRQKLETNNNLELTND